MDYTLFVCLFVCLHISSDSFVYCFAHIRIYVRAAGQRAPLVPLAHHPSYFLGKIGNLVSPLFMDIFPP